METVWITGASSGIGEACAYRWAEGGARLVITAPTAEELEPVAAKCREKGAPDVAVLPYDLSKPDGIPALVQSAWEAFSTVMPPAWPGSIFPWGFPPLSRARREMFVRTRPAAQARNKPPSP